MLIIKAPYQSFKLLPFVLSVLVLFATTGFTLNVHYCQGNVKSLALNNKAKTCKNMDENFELDQTNQQEGVFITKKKCCQSIHSYHSLELDMDLFTFKLNQEFDLILFDSNIHDSNTTIKNYSSNVFALNNSPPIDETDRYIVVQSFLI